MNRLSFLLLAFVLLTGCQKNDPTTIHGKVLDAHTGVPLKFVLVNFTVYKGHKHDSTEGTVVERPVGATGNTGEYFVTVQTGRPDAVHFQLAGVDSNYFAKNLETSLSGLNFGEDNTVNFPVFPKDATAELHIRHTSATSGKVQFYLTANYIDVPALFNTVVDLPVGDSLVATVRITGDHEHQMQMRPAGSNAAPLVTTFSVPAGATNVVEFEY
jgi:hypothetical protein